MKVDYIVRIELPGEPSETAVRIIAAGIVEAHRQQGIVARTVALDYSKLSDGAIDELQKLILEGQA